MTGHSNIVMGVEASDPEDASRKMRAYLASLPEQTEEEKEWWRNHMRAAASKRRPRYDDPRRFAPTVDPLSDPEAAA